MTRKTKITLATIGLAIIDIVIPVPIFGLIALYVVLEKPRWFYELVQEVYFQLQ